MQLQSSPLGSVQQAQAEPSAQAQAERRRLPQFQLPDHTYAAIESEGGPAGERGQRAGRLSLEERRALRRQINEAGSDLYIPRQ